MTQFKSGTFMLMGAMALVILTGCEQAEQAEEAEESASQVTDESTKGVDRLLGQTEEGRLRDSGEQGGAENQQDDEATKLTEKDKDQSD